jgi:hypothetical protein
VLGWDCPLQASKEGMGKRKGGDLLHSELIGDGVVLTAVVSPSRHWPIF